MPWTAPRTWVAGEVVTAAQLNTHVRDNLKALGDAWTPYTPTIGGFTVGNGVIAAAYRLVGQTLDFRFKFTAGSTSVGTAGMTITLPGTIVATFTGALGWAARDISANTSYFGNCDVFGGGNGFNLRATNPFVWAAGDWIGVSGTVEVS